MKTCSTLKSIALVSLTLSWLMASMAPGLLVHFSVGSRMIASAAQAPTRISAVTLAMVRGELCGFAAEVNKSKDREAEETPLKATESIKIVLSLEEGDLVQIVPQPPGISGFFSQQPGVILHQAPLGPPPKVS